MPEINQELVLEWIDLFWVIAAIIIPHKTHKYFAVTFVFLCVLTLRMEIELINAMGIGNGITGFFESSALIKGQIFYGIATAFYMLLSYYSKHTKPEIYMAASLTIYFFTSIFAVVIIAL